MRVSESRCGFGWGCRWVCVEVDVDVVGCECGCVWMGE